MEELSPEWRFEVPQEHLTRISDTLRALIMIRDDLSDFSKVNEIELSRLFEATVQSIIEYDSNEESNLFSNAPRVFFSSNNNGYIITDVNKRIQLRRELIMISSSAITLISYLDNCKDEMKESIVIKSGLNSFDDILEIFPILEKLIGACQEIDVPFQKSGRPPKKSREILIIRLADIYESASGKKAAVSLDGPFSRFVKLCLEPVSTEPLQDEARKTAIRRALGKR